MARPRTKVDEEEVDEIIKLKLEKLGGVKSKLTYNNVWGFNKEIANKQQHKRSNGKMFTLYGYQFWAAEYKGEPYLGKRRIDEIKNEDAFILAGKEYIAQMQDVYILVDRYARSPKVLRERMAKLLENDRIRIKFLEQEVKMLREKLKTSEDNLYKFQKGFGELFYKSKGAKNSLKNVMALNKSEDPIIVDELKGMFNNDISRFEEDNEFDDIGNKVVIPLEVKNKRRDELEKEGF
ncbi:hypothetical protein QTL86_18590 [Cellulosilyticum sp. ST5]|uniref:hypothetical protein n=1 Tax=Cellulosilyticum sp. ST5 TaxID=3055805 RepID=UPI0039779E70